MSLNPRITDWHGKTVWLIGASSGIGLATAQALHGQGAQVVVSARQADALQRFVDQHPGARTVPLDTSDHAALQAAALSLGQLGRIDAVVYCAGYYRAQRATAFDLAQMQQHLQVNYVGVLHMLDAVLPVLLRQGSGHISLVASVAGYSGLPQSLAYGPTKAALINLAETLYLDLHDQGIGVSLVCPGFVKTPLTAQNDFQMPALITPEQAATAMLVGWARGAFEIHFPKRFTLWMKALRLLPYGAYFRAVRGMTGL